MRSAHLHHIARRVAVAGALLALAAPAAATPTPATRATSATPAATALPGLSGFGPVTVGMPLERVRELLPAAQPIANTVMLGAPTLDSPYLSRLLLENQSFPGLPKPIDVELRFWKDRLWIVHLYTRDNPPEAVRAMLVERLGPPHSEHPRTLAWANETTTVHGQLALRWIAITDVEISREPQAWFRTTIGSDRPKDGHDPEPTAAPAP